MANAHGDSLVLIAAAVVIVFAVALLITFMSTSSVVAPTTSAPTTVPSNLSSATAPNLVSCNGFNQTISATGSAKSGQCTWLGGLMNVTVYGGNYDNVAIYFRQINSTTPFSTTYYGSPCASNSSALYMAVGNYNVTFSTGSLAQIGGRCGSATMRLSKA